MIQFPVSAEPGSVDAEKVFQLGLVDGPIAVIPGGIAVFFYLKYKLTREKHAEIQTALVKRRAAEAG